jgi:predicted nucleotidyltransferase component of viral defense system
MELFEKHEQFEMEVLQHLQRCRILEYLIFGGGTMLRLCHGLPRYSTDLDFYLFDQSRAKELFQKIHDYLQVHYTLIDGQDKYNTHLFELKSPNYPRKLKIQINKKKVIPNTQLSIAWSPNSSQQVPVTIIPLKTMMQFKFEAFIDRKEIRDAYDIEYLVRRGISLLREKDKLEEVRKQIMALTPNDYNIKLGSILAPDQRAYYRENKFSFLLGTIQGQLNSKD